jgi:AcrR family transcriptional regulator
MHSRTSSNHHAASPLAHLEQEPFDAGESPSAQPNSDGRINRSVVTRRKIVDALKELVYEGILTPTAEQVAKRAKIGLRTVFRHFDDLNSLYSEINEDLESLLLPAIHVRLIGNSWQERLMHSLELRAGLYDQIAAMYLAAQVHRHQSTVVTARLAHDVARMREISRHILPLVVQQNTAVFEALDLMMSLDAWVRLRRDQQLSAEVALDVVRLGVNAVLSTVAP